MNVQVIRAENNTAVIIITEDGAILARYNLFCRHKSIPEILKCRLCGHSGHSEAFNWFQFRVLVFQAFGIEIPQEFMEV